MAGNLQSSQEIYSSITLWLQFKYFFQMCKLIFFLLQLKQITSCLIYPESVEKVTSPSLQQNSVTVGSNCVPIHSLSHSCTSDCLSPLLLVCIFPEVHSVPRREPFLGKAFKEQTVQLYRFTDPYL